MTDSASIAPAAEDDMDDACLMRRIAGGDQRALGVLMQRHLPRTVRLATRMLGRTGPAEDVAQEAFIRVWKHAGRWRDPDAAGARFSTWLYRIVLNLCIDEKRKNRFVALDALPEMPDDAPDGEALMQQREQSARVRHALAQLPERQRQAFVLCFYEGVSNRDAAEMMDVGVKGLEALLVRARRSLRDMLETERTGEGR